MIGIIGAGISGLSLAYHLQKNKQPYILFEASDRPGGYIQSLQVDQYQLELGPNSVLIDTDTETFLHEIGLASQIIQAKDVSKHRYIYRKGKYRKLPSHPLRFISSGFFSLATKWAVYQETRRKAQYVENESLAAFFRRRFSQEIVDYALNPFVSGIYAGDPEKLLVEKTFPNLIEYERTYGSIIRGFVKNKSGARKKSISFKKGMEQLPKALAQPLEGLQLNCPVLQIEPQEKGFLVYTPKEALLVDQVVIASSAPATSKYLENHFSDWSQSLKKINYPPMTAVHTAYKRSEVGHSLDGFGGLNPKIEQQFTAGSIWTSTIFEGRCPEDEVLFTSFVGGSLSAAHTQKDAAFIQSSVAQELERVYQIKGKAQFQNLFAWEKAIPQYDLDAIPAQQFAQGYENQGIHVCANWLGGISLADAMRKGKELAQKLSKIPSEVKSNNNS